MHQVTRRYPKNEIHGSDYRIKFESRSVFIIRKFLTNYVASSLGTSKTIRVLVKWNIRFQNEFGTFWFADIGQAPLLRSYKKWRFCRSNTGNGSQKP